MHWVRSDLIAFNTHMVDIMVGIYSEILSREQVKVLELAKALRGLPKYSKQLVLPECCCRQLITHSTEMA